MLLKIIFAGSTGWSWQFLIAEPESAGREGGIGSVIISTIYLLVITLAALVPLGLPLSIYVARPDSNSDPTVRWLRRLMNILASVPSIVFGLFGNVFFSKILGLKFSLLSGGLTLSLMALPLFVSVLEQGLRSTHKQYHSTAAALSISDWRYYYKIAIPHSGLSFIIALALSIGRALAETAALIFTSGYVFRYPNSWLDSGRSLSVHIYDLAMNVPGGDTNAYKSTWILVFLVLVIHIAVLLIKKRRGLTCHQN